MGPDQGGQSLGATLTRELIARFLAGDRGAELRLFEKQRAHLLERARTHRLMEQLKKRCTPEDVVSEVFLRVMASGALASFEDRGRGSLRNLLFTVEDRVMVSMLRRETAEKRSANVLPLSCDWEEGRDMSQPAATGDPTPTSNARMTELLELCQKHLDAREWEIWRMAEVEGLDSPEIAKKLGTTSAAVRGVLFRARGKLVQALEGGRTSEG